MHCGNFDPRLVGVDTGKEALYANLKEEGSVGYCAFPSAYLDENGEKVELPNYDREYFEQITAEQQVTEMDGMTPVVRWEKKRERNEALDCRVLAMAALEDLNVKWKTVAHHYQRKLEIKPAEQVAATSRRPP